MEHVFHEPQIFIAGPEQGLKIWRDVERFCTQARRIPPWQPKKGLPVLDAWGDQKTQAGHSGAGKQPGREGFLNAELRCAG
jgi:hypothetical protein